MICMSQHVCERESVCAVLVCVCACVCVRACVRERARVCVFAISSPEF